MYVYTAYDIIYIYIIIIYMHVGTYWEAKIGRPRNDNSNRDNTKITIWDCRQKNMGII